MKKSVMTDWLEMPGSSRRNFSGVSGSEWPAATHESKPDQSAGEVLLAVGSRDDRPIVDSESVVHVPSGLCNVSSQRTSKTV